jgi:gliding motility-associated-like protein
MRDGVVINGQESATITVTESGTYSAVIKNGTCNGPASNTVTVTVENVNGTHYPDVNARPNIPVQLMAREIGVAYEWTPAAGLSDPSSVSPTVTTTTDRQYIVKITTAGGCVVSDTVNVKVKVVIFVPTAFSPDGNGTNDILRPLGELNSIEKFKIFNRWGQLMFETNVIGAGWDGKFKGADQPSDTYTWILTGVGKDGLPLKLSGKTLLVR